MNKEEICRMITEHLQDIIKLAESGYEEIVMKDVIDNINNLIFMIENNFDGNSLRND